MGTTHKKVIIRKVDRDTISGYVSASFIVDGKIEAMNTAGNVVSIDLREVKGVYFEIIEGMMPNDLVQDGIDGFSIIPPDTRSNTQRIFVPRSALLEMTVLAVIGEKKSQRRGRHPDDTRQVPMFT